MTRTLGFQNAHDLQGLVMREAAVYRELLTANRTKLVPLAVYNGAARRAAASGDSLAWPRKTIGIGQLAQPFARCGLFISLVVDYRCTHAISCR